MERKVHIIPYQGIKQEQQGNEIPRGVELIQAPAVWNRTRGQGVKVAVLDTGCDADHPDLKERIIGGRNFTDDDDSDPNIFTDYNGHGTHVAGTIAAAENEDGVVGVAPEADLLIIKVLNKQGSGQYDWIIQGIH
ncbi:serine protease, partial [Paenibacillus sp. 28ISP30-2]|nr:serine protease [Paenibacillus sp. 28ISP30-2]